MWRNLMAQALYQIIVLLTLTFKGKEILKLKDGNKRGHADKVRNTIIFNAFVFCQISNEFNARKPDQKNIFRGLHRNRLFIGIIGITLVLQVIIVVFLQKFAKTTLLNPTQWIISIAIGIISWPLDAIVKTIPVPEKPIGDYFRQRNLAENSLQYPCPMKKPEQMGQKQCKRSIEKFLFVLLRPSDGAVPLYV